MAKGGEVDDRDQCVEDAEDPSGATKYGLACTSVHPRMLAGRRPLRHVSSRSVVIHPAASDSGKWRCPVFGGGEPERTVPAPPPGLHAAHRLATVGRRPPVDHELPIVDRDDRERVDVDRE